MENRNTSRRDSCFHLIDSARPDFDQLVEFMLQTWTHRKWGRVCREAQPIQSLKFRLQQELERQFGQHSDFFRRNRRIMPRGDESTDSGSDRDSYSSDSAETEEDYERKDEDIDMELPFTKLLRVDDKTTTLRLPKKAIEFYFGTVLKDGSLTKEGEKGLQDKYRLGPEDS